MKSRFSQRGITLTGMMFWCVILAVIALLGMKVGPAYAEYYKIKKATKAIVTNLPNTASISEAKSAYGKYAQIDSIAVNPDDFEFAKEHERLVINYNYDKKIPLFANVSLVLAFSGSTNDR